MGQSKIPGLWGKARESGAVFLVVPAERDVEMESALGIPIDKRPCSLRAVLSKMTKRLVCLDTNPSPGLVASRFRANRAPLAEVTHSIEIGNAGSEVFHGLAFGIADNHVAVFLVEVGKVEEIEQAP